MVLGVPCRWSLLMLGFSLLCWVNRLMRLYEKLFQFFRVHICTFFPYRLGFFLNHFDGFLSIWNFCLFWLLSIWRRVLTTTIRMVSCRGIHLDFRPCFNLPLYLVVNLFLFRQFLSLRLMFHLNNILAQFETVFRVPLIIDDWLKNQGSDIIDPWICKCFQCWYKTHKFVVGGIIVPTDAGDTIFGLKLVWIWRIIDNNCRL